MSSQGRAEEVRPPSDVHNLDVLLRDSCQPDGRSTAMATSATQTACGIAIRGSHGDRIAQTRDAKSEESRTACGARRRTTVHALSST